MLERKRALTMELPPQGPQFREPNTVPVGDQSHGVNASDASNRGSSEEGREFLRTEDPLPTTEGLVVIRSTLCL